MRVHRDRKESTARCPGRWTLLHPVATGGSQIPGDRVGTRWRFTRAKRHGRYPFAGGGLARDRTPTARGLARWCGGGAGGDPGTATGSDHGAPRCRGGGGELLLASQGAEANTFALSLGDGDRCAARTHIMKTCSKWLRPPTSTAKRGNSSPSPWFGGPGDTGVEAGPAPWARLRTERWLGATLTERWTARLHNRLVELTAARGTECRSTRSSGVHQAGQLADRGHRIQGWNTTDRDG